MKKYFFLLWLGLVGVARADLISPGDCHYGAAAFPDWRNMLRQRFGGVADTYNGSTVRIWAPKNREWIKYNPHYAGSAFLVRFENYLFDFPVQINGVAGEVRLNNMPYTPAGLTASEVLNTPLAARTGNDSYFTGGHFAGGGAAHTNIYGFYDKNYLYLAEMTWYGTPRDRFVGYAASLNEAVQVMKSHQAITGVNRDYRIAQGSKINLAYGTPEFANGTELKKILANNNTPVSIDINYDRRYAGYTLVKVPIYRAVAKSGPYTYSTDVYLIHMPSTPPTRLSFNSMGAAECLVKDEPYGPDIAGYPGGVTTAYRIKLPNTPPRDNYFIFPAAISRSGVDSDRFQFYFLNEDGIVTTTNAPAGSMRVLTTSAAGKINAIAQ